MMRSHFYAVILCGLVCILLAACSGSPPPAANDEPTPVKVVVLPFLSFAPFYIAETEGYFAEENLAVEFTQVEQSSQVVPALAQGDVDVISGLPSVGMLNAMANDGGIKIVAGKGHIKPTGCVTEAFMISQQLADSGDVQQVADLAGKSFSLEEGTTDIYFTELMLDQAGLTLDDIVIPEDFPPFVEIDILGEGSLDVVLTGNPWLYRNINAGVATTFMPLRDLVPDFQMAILLYGPNFLETDRDAGVRFMRAYLKAVHQYNEGATERNVEILTEALGLEASELEGICWPHFRPDGSINVQSVLDFQDWAIGKGYLDTAATGEQIWEPYFIETAADGVE